MINCGSALASTLGTAGWHSGEKGNLLKGVFNALLTFCHIVS